MNCHEFQDRLQLFLDGEMPIHEETILHQHSKECPPCGEALHAASRLTDGLRHQPMYLPPPGFADRVLAKVLHRRRQHVQIALAASLLAVAFGMWGASIWLTASGRNPTDTAKASPTKGQNPLAALGVRLDRVVPVTLDATRQVVQDTVSTASSLMPPMDSFPVPSFPVPVEVTFVPLREMTQTVAISIEPVANSAQKTWNAIWRERPRREAP